MSDGITAVVENETSEAFGTLLDNFDVALAGGLIDAAQYVEGIIKVQIFQKFKASTGMLARSFRAVPVLKEDKSLASGVFSDLIYAKVQNDGMQNIHSKRPGGYLAIPISDYVKKKVGFWPRDWPGDALFCYKSRKGNLLLAEKKGSTGDIVNHYLLRKSVSIKGRHYIEEAKRQSEPGVEQILGDEVDAVLEKK